MDTFDQFIDSLEDDARDLNALPLCHTTTEGYFVNISESKTLMGTINHPPFPEPLIYFFYGKASYVVEEGDDALSFATDPPITFIYDLADLSQYKIRRLFPVDSGAFDMYGIKRGYKPDNFSHQKARADTIKTMVKLFYDDNDQYLEDRVNIEKLEKLQKNCLYLKELIALFKRIRDKQVKRRVGRQVYSIEIQYEDNIKFNPKYVLLPYDFFLADWWNETDFSKEFPNVKVDYYGKDEIPKANGNLEFSEYNRLMKDKVQEMLLKMKNEKKV